MEAIRGLDMKVEEDYNFVYASGTCPMDLFEELKQLCAHLRAKKIDFALCGGLAMAVYAFPRATMDIDIMVEPDHLEHVKEIGRTLGFNEDAGLMNFKNGAVQIYRLTKIFPGDPLILDILLVNEVFRPIWETREEVKWDFGLLPVVSPQGLIAMKLMRQSGQDQDDIKHLKRVIDED